MESHRAIIERLGGVREVARMLGHTNHTTVHGWYNRDNIPVGRWAELVQGATAAGKLLSASDLVPAEARDAAA